MNQIINMIMRIMMRKVVSKGIDAGFDKASSIRTERNGRKQQQLQGEIDGHGTSVKRGLTQQEVRAARRARRQSNGQA